MKQNTARQRAWKSIVSTLALIWMACIHLSAQNTTTRITISEDNIPISKALKEVARQLKTGVSYDTDLFRDRAISLHVTNTPYQEVLKKILTGTGLEGFITKEGSLSLRRLPPPRNGPIKLAGHITESAHGAPLASVTVSVKGSRIVALTDAGGAFTITVPDENAVLEVSYTGYEKKEWPVAGLSVLDIALRRANKSLDVVTVQAHRKMDNERALLNERRVAAVVSDGISAQNIEKTASITTTQALARVTGVTITDDKYVAVRGMGDRSVIALLNGARLSSSDPDRSAVPLDLVPAALLDNITVYKTMTPDRPADASAGIIELKTKSVPDSLTLEFTAQVGGNSTIGTSGRYNSFQGSDLGFFGQKVNNNNLSPAFNNLKNQYPGGLTQIQQMFLQSRNSPALTAEAYRVNSIMQSFSTTLATSYKPAAPNQVYTVSFGNNYRVFGDHQLGIILSANYYSRTEDRYNGQLNQYSIYQGIVTGSTAIYSPLHIPNFITPDNPRLGKYLGYTENSGITTLSYGALGGLTYRFNNRNQVQFQYVGSRGAEAQGNNLTGSWQNTGLQFPVYNQVNQLKQSYRIFNTYNFQGEHQLIPASWSPALSYNLSASKSTQNEPDFRFTDLADYRTQAFLDPNGQGVVSDKYAFVVGSVHGVGPNGVIGADPNGRKYRNLDEDNYNAKADLSQPFRLGGQKQLLKFGYNYLKRDRTFTENVLGLPGTAAGGDIDLLNKVQGNLNDLVSHNNIGLGDPANYNQEGQPRVGGFLYQIRKSPNNYTGTYETQAFYGMLDAHIGEHWRLTGGVRFESTHILAHVDTTNVFNPLVAAGTVIQGGVPNQGGGTTQPNTSYTVNAKPYYSVNLTYNWKHDMNFRLAYSTTLARPELRELTNIYEFDPFQFAVVAGNPSLQNQLTRSYDFRWEWFPNPGEVLSASVFGKEIEHQLNKVFIYSPQGAGGVFPEFPLIEYQNDPNKGHLIGIELEARKDLRRIWRGLRNFFIGANAMLASSTITRNPARLDANRTIDRYASDKSPLFEQPPYSINAYLDYYNLRLGTSITASFNVVGERLIQVQLDGSPDVYSRPVPLLDIVFSQHFLKRFTVKGFVKNVLNSVYRDVYATPGNNGLYHGVRYIQHEYSRGAEYALGLSYSLF